MARAKIISALIRVGLGVVFVYAGALKIWDVQQFALDVHHFELTPWTVSLLVAMYLPWLEVLAGVALIVRRLPLGASLAIAGMTLIFMGALASAWVRGLDISCGCFGKEAAAIRTDFPRLMLRDGALLMAALFALAAEARRTPARRG